MKHSLSYGRWQDFHLSNWTICLAFFLRPFKSVANARKQNYDPHPSLHTGESVTNKFNQKIAQCTMQSAWKLKMNTSKSIISNLLNGLSDNHLPANLALLKTWFNSMVQRNSKSQIGKCFSKLFSLTDFEKNGSQRITSGLVSSSTANGH